MNFTDFFIRRPIFAIVLSILIVVAGALALFRLPLSEYPRVAPTTVAVRATYPGASPETIASTVAAPLEQEINGVPGMLYASSQADAAGRMTLTVTFAENVEPDLAQINVQNRVARALPRLPAEVQALGVVTEKTSPDMLMVVHLVSPDGRFDALHLTNFALLSVRDELQRLPGVGDVYAWGAGEYAMRVWLDPAKLAARELTSGDIIAAIREQNVQVAAGALGESPQGGAPFQVSLKAPSRLASTEEFADIVVKSGTDGRLTRLRDVARVELGASSYALRSLLDNREATGIQINQAPGASALAVSAAVRAKMAELKRSFPEGIDYRIAYDPTIFVRASLRSVIVTLFEAVALVVIVVVLFLQSWRASLIPLAAVPVSIIGTFAAMHALGFSLNTLSLFGLVLAIGIVVDDAIVVVENVERHLARGIDRVEAARLAMREVTGPILATMFVLVAVFVPTAFLSGLSGQFYRQFALTIAISTVISAINSLTLSPALAATILRPHAAAGTAPRGLFARLAAGFFGPFNRFIERTTGRYVGGVRRFLRVGALGGGLYLALGALTWFGFAKTPLGFVPAQDKYYLVGIVQLPDGASLDRTEASVRQVTDLLLAEPGVETVVAFPGLSISGFANLPNAGVVFAILDPFEQRRSPELSAGAIAGRINPKLSAVRDGFSAIFPPPPVPGLGAIGGFKLQVQDRGSQGYAALNAATEKLLAAARQRPELTGLFTSFQVNAPQLRLDVDRDKAKSHHLALADVYQALQANLGSYYINDLTLFGRSYRVFVQSDAPFRTDESALRLLQARNAGGQLVPLATVVSTDYTTGPDRVIRYNAFPSADINGNAAPGVSSGQAVALMEQLAREHLPAGFTFEWTDLTYQQKLAGSSAAWVFTLCVLFAYLILAAQYNSWTLPLAVILIVPLTLLSALVGVWLTGGDNNLFTQIALIVLVGLASKNAILIVEFAWEREQEGATPLAAVLEAARLRLRPIVMTSLAFIVGVVPLVFAAGAGSEMRHAMGVAVFSGMLGVTLFGLFLTPLFYVALRRLVPGRAAHIAPAPFTSSTLNPETPNHV
ncbi:MAG: multidrug efflux RND transporter permease subunit [Opitutaceae bacterium]|nr:multidrug efflux RND transporter permease subunit [Opitutaceae bacterium]